MILGVGTDLVEIERIKAVLMRREARFLMRCFTPHEQHRAAQLTNFKIRSAYLAKRFAAKEAAVKAMGSGFDGRFGLGDIGVEEDAQGRPFLRFYNGAARAIAGLAPLEMRIATHVSLSDERAYAQAFVVIEACL